jgi:hypothetical protein
MVSNLPYIPQRDLTKLWGYGRVWINSYGFNEDKAHYLTKEMTKNITSYVTKNIKIHGFKCLRRYYCSKNINKPVTLYCDNAWRVLVGVGPYVKEEVGTKKFYVDYVGYITRYIYQMSRVFTGDDVTSLAYRYG